MPGVTTATGRLAWKVARRTSSLVFVGARYVTCLMNHAVFEVWKNKFVFGHLHEIS